jgi:hypothetical protein
MFAGTSNYGIKFAGGFKRSFHVEFKTIRRIRVIGQSQQVNPYAAAVIEHPSMNASSCSFSDHLQSSLLTGSPYIGGLSP